jgi:hypothetical protein
VLVFIAYTWHNFSVLTEVKTFLETKNKDDQKRLSKKVGRLRLRASEMWHKGENEDKLEELREKVKTAAKCFHVCIVDSRLTGN